MVGIPVIQECSKHALLQSSIQRICKYQLLDQMLLQLTIPSINHPGQIPIVPWYVSLGSQELSVNGLQAQEILDHLTSVAQGCVLVDPNNTLGEGYFSGVLNEMVTQHRNLLPRDAFLVFSQVRFPWKANDARGDIADYCFGRFDTGGRLSLQGGAELKIGLQVMQGLPEPDSIFTDSNVRFAFFKASVQACDQVKGAIKNGALPRNHEIRWIVAVGPYFTIESYNLSSDAELNTRYHKPNENSGDEDLLGMAKNFKSKPNARQMPIQGRLYRIGTREAAEAFHKYLLDGLSLYNDNDR